MADEPKLPKNGGCLIAVALVFIFSLLGLVAAIASTNHK